MKSGNNSVLQPNSPDERGSEGGGVELATAVRRIRELVRERLHGLGNSESILERHPEEGARAGVGVSTVPNIIRPVASQAPDSPPVPTVRVELDKQSSCTTMSHLPVTADALIDIAVFCLAALLSTQASVETARTRAATYSVALTDRQQAVLRLVAEGLSNKQIAASLGITVATVKTHLFWATEKLGAENRTHAAILASQRRLL